MGVSAVLGPIALIASIGPILLLVSRDTTKTQDKQNNARCD